MGINRFRSFLLDRGMVYFYAVYIAGYFLLPMATGHRKVYYALIIPSVLVLWRELAAFYRGNLLALLLLLYTAYMMSTLWWTLDFDSIGAAEQLGYSFSVLTFCFISGFVWQQYPQRMDKLAHRATWLAAGAAVVSIIAWYLDHPFPSSRLEPLGVMHHQNKASCAYGIFLVLCIHYIFTERGRDNKAIYVAIGAAILSLVLLTQSRTALAAVAVALLVLVGYRALGVLVLGAAASWALLAINPRMWQERVLDFSFRPGIWRQLIEDMPGYWWFGKGYLADPHVAAYERVFNHAHNGYLATLRDGGVVGLMLLMAMLAVALLWGWRLYNKRGERIYLALLLYGTTCITMDYDRLLVHPKELWLYFWLPIALIMAVYPLHPATDTLRYPGHKQ